MSCLQKSLQLNIFSATDILRVAIKRPHHSGLQGEGGVSDEEIWSATASVFTEEHPHNPTPGSVGLGTVLLAKMS